MVLFARLDSLLEENLIINKVQISFTRKARTSDHMFVLKSLIDKYINIFMMYYVVCMKKQYVC